MSGYRYVCITTRGASMWPALRSHDTLVVQTNAARVPLVGEVWVAQLNGQWLAHRARRTLGAGDALRVQLESDSGVPDPWLPKEALLGPVVAVVRRDALLDARAWRAPVRVAKHARRVLRHMERWLRP